MQAMATSRGPPGPNKAAARPLPPSSQRSTPANASANEDEDEDDEAWAPMETSKAVPPPSAAVSSFGGPAAPAPAAVPSGASAEAMRQQREARRVQQQSRGTRGGLGTRVGPPGPAP
jgi:hypothetical protein